jgi:hypothetical protein
MALWAKGITWRHPVIQVSYDIDDNHVMAPLWFRTIKKLLYPLDLVDLYFMAHMPSPIARVILVKIID